MSNSLKGWFGGTNIYHSMLQLLKYRNTAAISTFYHPKDFVSSLSVFLSRTWEYEVNYIPAVFL